MPVFSVALNPFPVRFGAAIQVAGIATGDGFTQSLQPGPRPREFDAEYGEADRYDDERGSGRHEHDDADQQDRRPDQADDDLSCCLVRDVKCSFYHGSCRSLGPMRQAPNPILAPFLALLLTIALPADADTDVVVAAQETEVRVAPRAAHLRLVNLPALEFALRAAYRCRGEAISLTLSVSDTVKTLARDVLADQRAAEVRLAVPAPQVAMAESGRFCIAGEPDSADELRVAGFATAAASLRCSRDGADSVRYASAPLTVRLVCARGEDQEPAASSGDR